MAVGADNTCQGAPDTVSKLRAVDILRHRVPVTAWVRWRNPQCCGRPGRGHPTQTEDRVKEGFPGEQLGHIEGTELVRGTQTPGAVGGTADSY